MVRPNLMTPERVSVMVGVAIALLATLPRYLHAAGQSDRLWLLTGALVVVLVGALLSWRVLEAPARRRLPGLLTSLALRLVLGLALVAIWQWSQGGVDRLMVLSHGTALGLLGHALLVGWRRRGA
ncbi:MULTISPECIES: hypothetical protein [unclassified Modicisalibacter]|uniref:hypothetical protein n=1 Tax=unclassified Modicisalibacter TaxID=2679913 RepID=UPI001CD00B8F